MYLLVKGLFIVFITFTRNNQYAFHGVFFPLTMIAETRYIVWSLNLNPEKLLPNCFWHRSKLNFMLYNFNLFKIKEPF